MSKNLVIWKYELEQFSNILHVPKGAEALSAVNQHNKVVVYYKINTHELATEERLVKVIGTGWAPEHGGATGKFLGTVVTAGGALVWHVFEEGGS